MPYNILADLVVILHGLFVLFVVLGGFFVLWRSAAVWFHVPAVLWGAALEFSGWICPLTDLEVRLRQKGGSLGYDAGTGFVQHYIVPVLYPESLTRGTQVLIGAGILLVNIMVYLLCWFRMRQTPTVQGK